MLKVLLFSTLNILLCANLAAAEPPMFLPVEDLSEIVDLIPASSKVQLHRSGTITFPLEISLDELQSMINEKAPESFGRDPEKHSVSPMIKDASLEYHIDRGTISLIPIPGDKGDVLGFDLPVSGTLSARGKLLRFIPTHAGLKFDGSIVGSVRAALNPDYSPDVQVAFRAEFDNASVKLFHAFSFNIRDHLEDELRDRGPEIQRKIQKELAKLDVPKRIEPFWAQLHNTIRVSRNPLVWIQIRPSSMAIAPMHFTADRRLVMNVEVETEATTFLGDKPPDQQVTKMPTLGRISEKAHAFKIAAPSYISLCAVGDFVGKKFFPATVDVNNQISVTFRKLCMASASGEVNCAVEVEAHGGLFGESLPLTLHVTMIPRLDAQKRELHFENLKYTVETQNLLAQSASALLAPVVLAKLQEKARFAYGDLLEKSRDKVNQIMTSKKAGKHVEVNVHFDKMEVTGLSVLDGQVVIVSDAEGELGLKLHP